MRLKIFELFAGYGGASFALKKAGIDFECVGYSEIDKFAIQCYEQNHSNEQWEEGYHGYYKQEYNIENYGDCTKINPDNLPDFDLQPSGNQQNFVYEPFIAASRGRNPKNSSDRTTGAPTIQRLEPKFDGTSNCISTVQKDNYVCIRNATKKGYQEAVPGDGINLEQPNSKTRRGRVQSKIRSTIQTNDQRGVLMEDLRIRKLTPKECFRLMGFLDDQINVKGISNSQQYKLAGNGWDINLVSKIFERMFK